MASWYDLIHNSYKSPPLLPLPPSLPPLFLPPSLPPSSLPPPSLPPSLPPPSSLLPPPSLPQCDADPEVTKAAVQEDKYENILTLISYYDTESRIPIRLLMLQVFGVLCGLDKEIINILLGSILPNELGRDIHNHLTGKSACWAEGTYGNLVVLYFRG